MFAKSHQQTARVVACPDDLARCDVYYLCGAESVHRRPVIIAGDSAVDDGIGVNGLADLLRLKNRKASLGRYQAKLSDGDGNGARLNYSEGGNVQNLNRKSLCRGFGEPRVSSQKA